MSFALTKFEARGVEIKTPSKKRGKQELVFTITGTTADVDLDIGDEDGTFWTDALADTTYDDLAASVFALLFTNALVDQAAGLMAVVGGAIGLVVGALISLLLGAVAGRKRGAALAVQTDVR